MIPPEDQKQRVNFQHFKVLLELRRAFLTKGIQGDVFSIDATAEGVLAYEKRGNVETLRKSSDIKKFCDEFAHEFYRMLIQEKVAPPFRGYVVFTPAYAQPVVNNTAWLYSDVTWRALFYYSLV